MLPQFRKESLPWIRELVAPLLAGPPEPLADTVDPHQLADEDSRFVTLEFPAAGAAGGQNGSTTAHRQQLAIHYKQFVSNRSTARDADPGSGEKSGDRRAPAVLMLHGFNGSEFNYRSVAQSIVDAVGATSSVGDAACVAVAYDRPPFGLSSRPVKWEGRSEDDPYTLSGAVAGVERLIERLCLTRVTSGGSAQAYDDGEQMSSAPITLGGSAALEQPQQQQQQWQHRGVVLVGHSAGAPIVLQAAAALSSGTVAGVVLVAPAVSTNPKGFLANADAGRLLR